MRNLYAELSPIKPDGSIETIRLCSSGANSATVIQDGHTWLPIITERPTIEAKLTNNGLLSEIQISYGSISFHMSSVFGNEVWSTYDFTGALCRLWWGMEGDALSHPLGSILRS